MLYAAYYSIADSNQNLKLYSVHTIFFVDILKLFVTIIFVYNRIFNRIYKHLILIQYGNSI